MSKKGTKYIGVSRHAKNSSIPILKIVKDIMKIAQTRKEVKQILKNKDLFVNNKRISDERFPIQIDDIISNEKTGKKYRARIKDKKFYVEEISGKDADKKIVKVTGKKTILNGKIQLNLRDGQNILSEEPIAVGDSIVLDLKTKKIDKILQLKEKCIVEILSGQYAGKKGIFVKIEERKRKNVYLIKLDKKEIGLSLDLIKVTE